MRIRDKVTGREYDIVSMMYEEVGGGSLFSTGTPDDFECVPCRKIYESNPVTREEFEALKQTVEENRKTALACTLELSSITGKRLAELESK